ncbi:MAG TPA: hypothetical protein VK280_27200 [Streptosporangiaceae bacterium]|nr:hypothetical protein [Streptosporangiaceae bacterium]
MAAGYLPDQAADLSQGTGLTPRVAAAVGIVATAILDDIGPFAGTSGT